MSTLTDLQAQLADIQAKIALFSTFPEDTYNFGTLVLFASQNNTKHTYYRKNAEESWKPLKGTDPAQPLAEWLYKFKTEQPDEYFEVYVMSPGNLPIYASA